MKRTPAERREYLLDLALVIAGSWQATGCEDEALEAQFEQTLTQIHPNRKTALLALQMHIAGDTAA